MVPLDDMHHHLRGLLEPIGQTGILRWWTDLSPAERQALYQQVSGLDLDLVGRLARRVRDGLGVEGVAGALSPPEIASIAQMDRDRIEEARGAGVRAIRAGGVACCMVAGGQATRLGIEGPKGAVPITPIEGKSLFQLHAERVLASSRRYEVAIPWLILTSDATETETRAFFDGAHNFDLEEGQITYLRQDSLPAFGATGEVLMRSKSEMFLGPDGHGGILKALSSSGALRTLLDDGREVLSYFQVDNPLVPPLDPIFIGLHILGGAEVSSKVAEKTDPDEKVGVFALREGRLGVVEYTEISADDRTARDAGGRLSYRGGNLAIHAWSLPFLDGLQAGGGALPYHPARKVVPCIDESGHRMDSTAPNGIKFESFIFDAIPLARKGIVMEVLRDEEFQPVKASLGDFTAEAARRALSRLHGSWLRRRIDPEGGPRGDEPYAVEVSPLYALDEDEFRRKTSPDLEVEGPIYFSPTGLQRGTADAAH